jgi:hypothetical protein
LHNFPAGAPAHRDTKKEAAMPTTEFRPSLHGWPFVNLFHYSVELPLSGREVGLKMGFCGGMCWLALEQFSRGEPIARDLAPPAQDDPLYGRLFDVQVKSLPLPKIARIYDWQRRPPSGRRGRSLGAYTKREWERVREMVDDGTPVTVTLLQTAADVNPWNLQKNHRVAIYGYEVRELADDDEIRGERRDDIRAVVLNIYDPNYPNDDEVTLTFFTGCDDDWIGLTHNRGASAFGFFLDDARAGE